MATMFKTFMENDIVSTRTLLHEAIPITGSIVSGTYVENDTVDSETNIKNYSHGLFQSVYDYPYLSSSANHIFDLTIGYSAKCHLSGTAGTRLQQSDKINIYNQMAQILVGHDKDGTIREFDQDGSLTGGAKMNSVFFMNFSRLLVKDEIKKGSFKLQLLTGSSPSDPAATRKDHTTSAAATALITTCAEAALQDTKDFTLTNAAGVTITFNFTGGKATSTNEAAYDATSDVTVDIGYSDLGSGDAGLTGDEIVTRINAGTGIDMVATKSGDNVLVTQGTVGPLGNTTITAPDGSTGLTLPAAFTGGGHAPLTLQDHSGDSQYKVNSPAGEYGLLYSASADTTNANQALGHIYYQAGIAVITSSVFRRDDLFLAPWDDSGEAAAGQGVIGPTTVTANAGTEYAGCAPFGWLPGHKHGTDYLPTGSVEAMFVSASISGSCSGFRNALYNVEFNNTTELNSTIYFCRASHNEFNYTSNPTYLSDGKIRVKNSTLDQPVSYITSIGLYSAQNELLAVAKLSEPIKKTPETELTFRVRLDY